MGNEKTVTVSKRKPLECEVALAPAGTAGAVPAGAEMLLACALSETKTASDATYEPGDTGDTGFSSASLYYHKDDGLHHLLGARRSASISISAKDFPKVKFSFTGLYQQVTTAALPTTDWTDLTDPVGVDNENTPVVTLDGINVVLNSFDLDFGESVAHRDLPVAEAVRVNDRKPMASITIDAMPLTTVNWEQKVANDEVVPLVIEHGTVAGSKIRIEIAQVQLKSLKPDEADGIRTQTIESSHLPGSDSEPVITFL